MGWDRKRNGPESGYYYKSVRVPGRPHPVKVYFGRGIAGHEAAADQELRSQGRLEAKKLLHAERDSPEEADLLAAELRQWAGGLMGAWMVLTGHSKRRGQWGRSRG